MFKWPQCPGADPKSTGDSQVPGLKMLRIITRTTTGILLISNQVGIFSRSFKGNGKN